MANTVLTPSIVAAEALTTLDNELVMANLVHRAHEDEFTKKVNGYDVGETITIRRPTDFTVRDGAVAAAQDVVEGSTTLTLNKRKGIDFKFTSQDLTTKISDLSERVIRPAMVQLANQVDSDLLALYTGVSKWVGTPGQTVNSYADFALGPKALDNAGVPQDSRAAVLSPDDHWGLLGSQTALYMSDVAKGAYRERRLGMIGGVDTYMTQNVPTLTVGSRTGSIKVNGSITTSTVTYSSVKDTMTQTINIDGFGGATQTVAAGDVFTIAGVFDVNPVTKATLPTLKQFTVTAAATASGSATDITFTPAMIWTGAFKTVAVVGVTNLDNQDVTFVGTASTGYPQNLVFHKNAFALAVAPLIIPPGAHPDAARKSYKSLSVRVIPVYDGINDESLWRLDILYGVKTLDGRLATRLSGTA